MSSRSIRSSSQNHRPSLRKQEYSKSSGGGWIGFGRNYFRALGNNLWEQQHPPQEKDSKAVTSFRYTGSAACRSSKTTEGARKAPLQAAACSSAASFFQKDDHRVVVLGTIHGRVMDPAEEAAGTDRLLTPSVVVINVPLKIVELSAGRHFCLARLEGGVAVCSWGAGHFGQLGRVDDMGQMLPAAQNHPRIVERLLPRVVGSPIKQIAAGDWHALALTEAGTVFAWGCNRNGQCGRKPSNVATGSGSNAPSAPLQITPMPVSITSTPSASSTHDNTSSSSSHRRPLAVLKVACGRAHSVAITENHQVYCWGAAHHGQCGNVVLSSRGNTISKPKGMVVPGRLVEGLQELKIVDIAAGEKHTLALSSGGRVFAWGSGAEGQLGTGSNASNGTPPFCSARPCLISDLDFIAIAARQEWRNRENRNEYDDKPKFKKELQNQLSSIPTIKSVYAAGNYSVALSSSGHVYSWGCNDTGVLGLSTPPNMPLVEPGIEDVKLPDRSSLRLLDVQTFDSSHNVLIPRRVQALDTIKVETVECGLTHMWCYGETRSSRDKDTVGRTLHEIQVEELDKKEEHERQKQEDQDKKQSSTRWERNSQSNSAPSDTTESTPSSKKENSSTPAQSSMKGGMFGKAVQRLSGNKSKSSKKDNGSSNGKSRSVLMEKSKASSSRKNKQGSRNTARSHSLGTLPRISSMASSSKDSDAFSPSSASQQASQTSLSAPVSPTTPKTEVRRFSLSEIFRKIGRKASRRSMNRGSDP